MLHEAPHRPFQAARQIVPDQLRIALVAIIPRRGQLSIQQIGKCQQGARTTIGAGVGIVLGFAGSFVSLRRFDEAKV